MARLEEYKSKVRETASSLTQPTQGRITDRARIVDKTISVHLFGALVLLLSSLAEPLPLKLKRTQDKRTQAPLSFRFGLFINLSESC